MDWNTVVTALTATSIGSAAFVFLAKALTNHLFSIDLERFKTALKGSHEKEIERLRSDLRMVAFEREIRFVKLHEKRLDIIAELYRRLSAANIAMSKLVSPMQFGGKEAEKQNHDRAADACQQFRDYYLQHRIYFDVGLCEHLDGLDAKFWQIFIHYYMYDSDDQEVARERRKTQLEAWDQASEEVPPMLREIERSFRTLLGHEMT
jgi:hypothetical protein